MLILILLLNFARATTPSDGVACESGLTLTENRGVEFYDRVASAAAAWFADGSDSRRPRVFGHNVVEVRHRADGGGEALVELQTAFGRQTIPLLVRVNFERREIKDFAVTDRGLAAAPRGEHDLDRRVLNAAVARLLTSTDAKVENPKAGFLSRGGYKEGFDEVLVSAIVDGSSFEKVYVVFSNEDGVQRIDEGGTNRYPRSVLGRNFERLLLGDRKDPTLRITSISRLTSRSWRVSFTLGKVERVKEDPPSRAKRRPANQIEIGPSANLVGRVVYTGDGLEPRSMILRVDDDRVFSLGRE